MFVNTSYCKLKISKGSILVLMAIAVGIIHGLLMSGYCFILSLIGTILIVFGNIIAKEK